MTDFAHEPVLADEVLAMLLEARPERILDATVGGGGHAALLLENRPQAFLLGLDRDEEAVAAARERLRVFSPRVQIARTTFAEFATQAKELGWESCDAILLDLGVSSHQLNTPERGFSYRTDGPLDMRMDRRSPRTAARLLNTATQDELERIFREYGEERRARALARAVVARRDEHPFARTAEFAELAERVVGRARHGPPAPTRAFQGLRIAVNEELQMLEETLPEMVRFLRPGGRIAVTSFHSLEDRTVKRRFRHEAATCVCPPGMPECRCDKIQTLRVLTRKPVRPSKEEIERNRRAAPARLRVAERTPEA